MTKNVFEGSCLTRPLETQASDSTGFQNLSKMIVDLYESKVAYEEISVNDPGIKCLFMASLIKWAHLANYRVLDHLERINKGECTEVLTLNYAKFCNKAHWQGRQMKRDMMAYSDKPLKAYHELWNSDETSMDLYQQYESNVFELAVNLKKVRNSFDHPELYENLMQQMKEQYADSGIAYEYEQMKDEYIEPSLKNYLKMEVKVCIDYLESGMLDGIFSISNDEEDEVDEEKLYKLLDTRCKVPANLKELWAKLKKVIEVKEGVMLVLRRDLIRKQVLKHFDDLTGDHFCALFRLEKFLELIHKDMVELEPGLAKNMNQADDTNTFGIVNSLTRLIQQPWFEDFRTDSKYDHAWIENFVSDLLASEHQQELLDIWQVAKKRQMLKGYIIGCLKTAGVIDGSDLGIATALLNGSRKENTNFAVYMGRGKKMAFCDWICDYVKR